jgi:hypothetical protein
MTLRLYLIRDRLTVNSPRAYKPRHVSLELQRKAVGLSSDEMYCQDTSRHAHSVSRGRAAYIQEIESSSRSSLSTSEAIPNKNDY